MFLGINSCVVKITELAAQTVMAAFGGFAGTVGNEAVEFIKITPNNTKNIDKNLLNMVK
jgi:hypothetical protein